MHHSFGMDDIRLKRLTTRSSASHFWMQQHFAAGRESTPVCRSAYRASPNGRRLPVVSMGKFIRGEIAGRMEAPIHLKQSWAVLRRFAITHPLATAPLALPIWLEMSSSGPLPCLGRTPIIRKMGERFISPILNRPLCSRCSMRRVRPWWSLRRKPEPVRRLSAADPGGKTAYQPLCLPRLGSPASPE